MAALQRSMDSRLAPYAVGVGELVALDFVSASATVEQLHREWDTCNAVLIVDQRLPLTAKAAMLDALEVHCVVDATGRTRLHPRAEPMHDADALVVATSGTTGEAKGVVHTHDGLRAASLATAAALRCGVEAHWLACLPIAHIGGFGVLTRAWNTGARLTIHDSFSVAEVENSGATHVSLVPTALQRLNPSLFERVLLGGSRPPRSLPHNVVSTYGLTESCGGVVYNRRPVPGVQVAIAHDGEILLRGPMIMDRYRGPALPSPVDADGWLHTNDIGLIENGSLDVLGRRGDMIVTGGEKVWPDAVERALATHPEISDCAVAGTPDDEWGEIVTAWIVPRSGSRPTLDELRDHVGQFLPRYCCPREVILVGELPRNTLGKLIRHALHKPT